MTKYTNLHPILINLTHYTFGKYEGLKWFLKEAMIGLHATKILRYDELKLRIVSSTYSPNWDNLAGKGLFT